MSFQFLFMLLLLFMLFTIARSTSSRATEKLDQTLVPQEPDAGIKCGSCPCVNPCAQILHPPPPPPRPPPALPMPTCCTPLAPPPPRFIYVTGPLAPPPPRFVYVTGVPGSLFEADPDDWGRGFYNGAARQNVMASLLLLVGFGVVDLLVIW